MTDQDLRAYFKNLVVFLNAKHREIPNLEMKDTPNWVTEIIDVISAQIKRPTGLTLYSSSSAFEKEFLRFLQGWRRKQRDTRQSISAVEDRHYLGNASIYLRQLSRLYAEIYKQPLASERKP